MLYTSNVINAGIVFFDGARYGLLDKDANNAHIRPPEIVEEYER